MINLDSLTIKAFLKENYDFFIGAKIQKIQQPNRRELIFHLRNNSESRKFYININPSFYHIAFMSKENEEQRNIKIPKSAAMFCMLLRKYISGLRIVDVQQPNYERIIEFYFDFYDALNERSKLCLAIELMGKHSNIVLYNYDTNVIVGCAHNVGAEKSKDRELAGLLPYIYPPKQKKKDILKISFEKFYSLISEDVSSLEGFISNSFFYISRPLARQLLAKYDITENTPEPVFKELYREIKSTIDLNKVVPNITPDYSEFSIVENKNNILCENVNDMLDDYFAFHQSQKIMQNIKSKLYAIINHQIKKLTQLKDKQSLQLKNIDKALLYKNKGDLIMANLYSLDQNQSKVQLVDFDGQTIVPIDLDTTLSLTDNANRYYKLYKKTKSAYEYSKSMIEETISQLAYFEEQKFYVDISTKISELEDVSAELDNINAKKEKQNQDKKEIVIAEHDVDGYKILVGKNSRQNDYLLSKIASPNDIWFHPLNMAGSHVILKRNSAEAVPDEVLFEAAKLAKIHSSARNSTKVPIIYTLRKYVKKATAKGHAFVTYKNETEILVD